MLYRLEFCYLRRKSIFKKQIIYLCITLTCFGMFYDFLKKKSLKTFFIEEIYEEFAKPVQLGGLQLSNSAFLPDLGMACFMLSLWRPYSQM